MRNRRHAAELAMLPLWMMRPVTPALSRIARPVPVCCSTPWWLIVALLPVTAIVLPLPLTDSLPMVAMLPVSIAKFSGCARQPRRVFSTATAHMESTMHVVPGLVAVVALAIVTRQCVIPISLRRLPASGLPALTGRKAEGQGRDG